MVSSQYKPSLSEKHPGNYLGPQITQYTEGDLHGNTLRLLESLVFYGVVSTTKESYADFVNQYTAALNDPDNKLKNIALIQFIRQHFNVKNKELLARLIGDVVSDRTGNDLFTLVLIHKLVKEGANLRILASNHDLNFVNSILGATSIEEVRQRNEWMYDFKTYGQGISFIRLIESVERGEISFEELQDMTRSYLSCMKLLDYSVDRNNGLKIFSHAPINLDILKDLGKQFGDEFPAEPQNTSEEEIKVFHTNIRNFVDQINRKFKSLLQLGNGNLTKMIFNDPASPAYRVIWTREKELGKKIIPPKYDITNVYGHDSSMDLSQVGAKVVRLDTRQGKGNCDTTDEYTTLADDDVVFSALRLLENYLLMDSFKAMKNAFQAWLQGVISPTRISEERHFLNEEARKAKEEGDEDKYEYFNKKILEFISAVQIKKDNNEQKKSYVKYLTEDSWGKPLKLVEERQKLLESISSKKRSISIIKIARNESDYIELLNNLSLIETNDVMEGIKQYKRENADLLREDAIICRIIRIVEDRIKPAAKDESIKEIKPKIQQPVSRRTVEDKTRSLFQPQSLVGIKKERKDLLNLVTPPGAGVPKHKIAIEHSDYVELLNNLNLLEANILIEKIAEYKKEHENLLEDPIIKKIVYLVDSKIKQVEKLELQPEPHPPEAQVFQPEPHPPEVQVFQPEPHPPEVQAFQSEPHAPEVQVFQPEPHAPEIQVFQPEPHAPEVQVFQPESHPPEAQVFQPEPHPPEVQAFQPEPHPPEVQAFQPESAQKVRQPKAQRIQKSEQRSVQHTMIRESVASKDNPKDRTISSEFYSSVNTKHFVNQNKHRQLRPAGNHSTPKPVRGGLSTEFIAPMDKPQIVELEEGRQHISEIEQLKQTEHKQRLEEINKRADHVIDKFAKALTTAQISLNYQPLEQLIQDLEIPHTQFKERQINLVGFKQTLQHMAEEYKRNCALTMQPKSNQTILEHIFNLFKSLFSLINSMIEWLFPPKQPNFLHKSETAVSLKSIDEKIESFEDDLRVLINSQTGISNK